MCRYVVGEYSGGENSRCKDSEGGDQRLWLRNRTVVGDEHIWLFCHVDMYSYVMKLLSSPKETVRRWVTPLYRVGLARGLTILLFVTTPFGSCHLIK